MYCTLLCCSLEAQLLCLIPKMHWNIQRVGRYSVEGNYIYMQNVSTSSVFCQLQEKDTLPPTGGGRFFSVFVNACMCMLHIHKLVYGVLFASLNPPFALIRKFQESNCSTVWAARTLQGSTAERYKGRRRQRNEKIHRSKRQQTEHKYTSSEKYLRRHKRRSSQPQFHNLRSSYTVVALESGSNVCMSSPH